MKSIGRACGWASASSYLSGPTRTHERGAGQAAAHAAIHHEAEAAEHLFLHDVASSREDSAHVPAVDDFAGGERNAFPFDVRDGESRTVWVEYQVPQGAKPGKYRGGVKVTTGEGEAIVPVTLTVWDFELPSISSLQSYFAIA